MQDVIAASASRLAIGSHKWSQLNSAPPPPSSSGGNSGGNSNSVYHDIIETALANGVTTLEVGQGPGADAALSDILSKIIPNIPPSNTTITLLKRVGYRTVLSSPPATSDTTSTSGAPPPPPLSMTKLLPGDVQVEDIQVSAAAAGAASSSSSDNNTTASVVHNISQSSIQAALDESALCQQNSNANSNTNMKTNMVVMLHNPEVQASASYDSNLLTAEQRQARICDKLTESFLALEDETMDDDDEEEGGKNKGRIASYGIVSNGLALPPDHPLHLSFEQAIVPALQQAQQEKKQLSSSSSSSSSALRFSIVQLPINLMETDGLQVAQRIKQHFNNNDNNNNDKSSNVQIYAMRPLTAYPDRGTGSGHPFVFCDYQLPATMEKTLTWTHEMSAPPQVYQVALQAALSHFDATEILEKAAQEQERDSSSSLTAEQRETLDGCKLLQSLLHDVDNGLDQVRSWQVHEDYLYQQVIPLIHDTFEGYDEETAAVLQRFFAAYSLAVRYSIAQNTRRLLVQGGEAEMKSGQHHNTVSSYPDLPTDMKLQDFALRFLLDQSNDVIDKLIVGCTEPDHVIHDLEVVHQHQTSSSSSPQ